MKRSILHSTLSTMLLVGALISSLDIPTVLANQAQLDVSKQATNYQEECMLQLSINASGEMGEYDQLYYDVLTVKGQGVYDSEDKGEVQERFPSLKVRFPFQQGKQTYIKYNGGDVD